MLSATLAAVMTWVVIAPIPRLEHSNVDMTIQHPLTASTIQVPSPSLESNWDFGSMSHLLLRYLALHDQLASLSISMTSCDTTAPPKSTKELLLELNH
jgi:hypothetical protein